MNSGMHSELRRSCSAWPRNQRPVALPAVRAVLRGAFPLLPGSRHTYVRLLATGYSAVELIAIVPHLVGCKAFRLAGGTVELIVVL